MEALRDRIWTYEDYLRLPDDGKRYEIIDGVLYVSPAPRLVHQAMSKHLQQVLFQQELAGRGWVFNAPVEVRMPGADPVQPDLVFIAVEQRSLMRSKAIVGSPKLIVELLSPTTARYDRVIKLNKYAACGVPHYWIGDPRERTLELFRLDGEGYRLLASLGPGDRFDHPDFVELTLDLDHLFALIPPELEEDEA